MVIKELETCLMFMRSVGYSEQFGARVLSAYFNARALGKDAEAAAQMIFDEIDSRINRQIALKEKIKAQHKSLCQLYGYTPEEVSAAIEDFYNV